RLVPQMPIPDPRMPPTTMAPGYLKSYLQTKQDDYRIQIRRANVNDAPPLSEVLEKAFIEYRPLYTPKGYAATAIGPDEMLERISEGPVWVASLDGELVGTVAAVPKDDGLYVRGMGVVPTARGKRIG